VLRLPLLLALAILACPVPGNAAKSTIKVRLPKILLPARSNIEVCYYARVDATTPFSMGSFKIMHPGAKGATLPQHGLVYLYTGEHLADLGAGNLVSSRGCLDLGPSDRDRRVLIASGAQRSLVRKLPTGVAVDLDPAPDAPGGAPAGIGILVDVNWVNDDTKPHKVSTTVQLKRAPVKKVTRHARPFSDRTAETGLLVPPFTENTTADLVDARWSPSGDVCVLGLSAQMHRRGRCAGVDLLDAQGTVKTPAFAITNPCEPDQRQQLFVGVDFTDPGSLAFTAPLAVGAAEKLRYSCWTDNGVQKTVRLGCETQPGVPPGAVGAPSALCTFAVPASAECPGNAACVPANAVAGLGADDEVCGITGLVYDAAPGGGCDVSSAP
jgi:hypothetical protein